MFQGERVLKSVWPEGVGVVSYLGGVLVAAAIDAGRAKAGEPAPTPWAQNIFTGGCLVGGVLGIGYNKAPEFSTGLVYGSGVNIMATSVRAIYERVAGQAVGIKASDVMALEPRKAILIKGAGGNGATDKGLGLGKITLKNMGTLGAGGGGDIDLVQGGVPSVETALRYE